MNAQAWKTWKLAHAYPRIGSGTTPTSNVGEYYCDEGGVPWVTTAELRENYITDSAVHVTREALAGFSALRIYEADSLMIAMYGATIGRLGITLVPASCNQACCVFERSEQFDNRFLYYWLWHRRGDLVAMSSGGGQPNLSQQDLREERALCPPLGTQQRIARFLDEKTSRIDALIEKKQALLERLSEKRQALITSAVTKGLNPDVPMKPSGVDWLGDVPFHWSVAALGCRYEVQLGRMLNADRADGENLKPYLRVSDVQWGEINTSDLPLMDFPPDAQKRYRLATGDLLVNEGGSYVGRSAIWRGEIDECYYQKALHRLRPLDTENDTTDFLYFVMEAATKNLLFKGEGNQTTIDHLTAEQLRRYRFAFPPLSEQLSICSGLTSRLEIHESCVSKVESSLTRLSELRSALITAAVTGQLPELNG